MIGPVYYMFVPYFTWQMFVVLHVRSKPENMKPWVKRPNHQNCTVYNNKSIYFLLSARAVTKTILKMIKCAVENSQAKFRTEPWAKWVKRVKVWGLSEWGIWTWGWCSWVLEGGVAGLCRDGSLHYSSLQFLLNYSSAVEQGQACSACVRG